MFEIKFKKCMAIILPQYKKETEEGLKDYRCIEELVIFLHALDEVSPLSKAVENEGGSFSPFLWTGAPDGGLLLASKDAISLSQCSIDVNVDVSADAEFVPVVFRSLESHTALGVIGQYLQYIIHDQTLTLGTQGEAVAISILQQSPAAITADTGVTVSIDPFTILGEDKTSYWDFTNKLNGNFRAERYGFRLLAPCSSSCDGHFSQAKAAYNYWALASAKFAGRSDSKSKAGFSFIGPALRDKVWANDEIPRLVEKGVSDLWIVWHNELKDSLGVDFTKDNFNAHVALPIIGAMTHFDGTTSKKTFPADEGLKLTWYQCNDRDDATELCNEWVNFGGKDSDWNTAELNSATLKAGDQAWTANSASIFKLFPVPGSSNPKQGSLFEKIKIADAVDIDVDYWKRQESAQGTSDPYYVDVLHAVSIDAGKSLLENIKSKIRSCMREIKTQSDVEKATNYNCIEEFVILIHSLDEVSPLSKAIENKKGAFNPFLWTGMSLPLLFPPPLLL